jgi:hypothetical protein
MGTKLNLCQIITTTTTLLAISLLLPAGGQADEAHHAGSLRLDPPPVFGIAELSVEGVVRDVVVVDVASESVGRGSRTTVRSVYLDVITFREHGRLGSFRLRCGALEADCFALEPGARVRAAARFTTVERVFAGQVTSPPELVEVEVLEPRPVHPER